MARLNRQQVIQLLADSSDLPTSKVEQIFVSLRALAAEHVADGFLVPELGEFYLVPGAPQSVRNPATGEIMTVRGRPVLGFKPDTDTADQVLEQPTSSHEARSEPARSLPEIRLQPNESDWQTAQKDCKLKESANHKLGGDPTWVQDASAPICCAREMTFYGQFDSGVGGPFNVVDAAVILVFLCDSCAKSRALVQSY